MAYYDPIKLTIRTNLGFSFVNDCASQALLWTYVEASLANLRTYGLRGAYECVSKWKEFESADEAKSKAAAHLFKLVAAELTIPYEALINVMTQIRDDPYATFLYYSWHPEDDEETQ